MNPPVTAVAAYGLDTRVAIPAGPFDDETFDLLLVGAEEHRVLGQLGAAARDGALVVSEMQRERLEKVWRGWLVHDVRLEQLAVETVCRLDGAGIPSRLLKGLALARTAYPEPACRVYGDLDVLVPGDRLVESADVLGAAFGAVRVTPELRPGFDDRFGKEAMLRHPDGLELDVHRTFVDGALGLTVDLDDLFVEGQAFALGGHVVHALAPTPAFLHACYSAVLGDWPPRLAALRDVAQLVHVGGLDPSDVRAMAARWRADAVVARAVTLAWEELRLRDGPEIVAWARAFRARPADRLLLASHVGRMRAFTRHLAALLVIPGVRARAAYVRAIAFPQPAYLEARQFTARSHLARMYRRFRR